MGMCGARLYGLKTIRVKSWDLGPLTCENSQEALQRPGWGEWTWEAGIGSPRPHYATI